MNVEVRKDGTGDARIPSNENLVVNIDTRVHAFENAKKNRAVEAVRDRLAKERLIGRDHVCV